MSKNISKIGTEIALYCLRMLQIFLSLFISEAYFSACTMQLKTRLQNYNLSKINVTVFLVPLMTTKNFQICYPWIIKYVHHILMSTKELSVLQLRSVSTDICSFKIMKHSYFACGIGFSTLRIYSTLLV